MEVLIVLTTCPHDASARIARELVQKKLAACVNVVSGIQSVYRWHDAVEEAREDFLMIKTSAVNYAALEKEILALHPYELPEIVALPVEKVSSAYLEWVLTSCREEFHGDIGAKE